MGSYAYLIFVAIPSTYLFDESLPEFCRTELSPVLIRLSELCRLEPIENLFSAKVLPMSPV